MPSKIVKPPDVMGYRLVLEELVSASGKSKAEKTRVLDMLTAFATSYQQLDQWRLKNIKAKEFGPGEPCFLGDAPCVVLAVTNQRVSVRVWMLPPVRSCSPMPGQVKFFQGSRLIKVCTRALFEQWVWAMHQCGHQSEHWTTLDMMAVAQ